MLSKLSGALCTKFSMSSPSWGSAFLIFFMVSWGLPFHWERSPRTLTMVPEPKNVSAFSWASHILAFISPVLSERVKSPKKLPFFAFLTEIDLIM